MKLGKGINYSRYCLWWEGTENINRTDYMMPDVNKPNRDKISSSELAEATEHIKLIKKLGFQTVRLPVSFNVWAAADSEMISQNPYWVVVENMIAACEANNLKLVIDYHHAPLSDATLGVDKQRIMTFWQQIAEKLKNTAPEKVLFEIFNEPNFGISTPNLVMFYQEIVAVIRNTGGNNMQRKIIVGGNGFYEIGFGNIGLIPFLQFNPFFNDQNIIYTVHFYEPRFFTMQGLDDNDVFFPVENVEFPATKDFSATNPNEFFANNYFMAKHPDIIALNIGGKGMGSIEFIEARMKQLKDLEDSGIQIWCSEIGVYRFFAEQVQDMPIFPNRKDSLKRYLTTLINSLNNNGIEWCWWDFEGGMSFFNPVPRLQLARPELGRLTDSPDFAKAFGFAAPYSDNKIDPLMRTLLGLNERVKIQILSVSRNTITKKDTARIQINCFDDLSNIKNFEVSYQFDRKIRDVSLIRIGVKILTPAKIIKTSITQLGLFVNNLRVNHHDGSFFDIKP